MSLFARVASLPLRAKLLFGLFTAALIAILIVSFAVNQYSEAVQPIGGVLTQALAQERAALLGSVVQQTVKTVSQLSTDSALLDAYASLAADPQNPEARQVLESAFQRTLNADPTYRQLRFVSPEGQVLVAVPPALSPDDTGRAYFLELRNQPAFEAVYLGRLIDEPLPLMDFVAAPARDGRRLGYLALDIDPSGSAAPDAPSLYRALGSYAYRAGTIAFYLVAPDGRIESPFLAPIVTAEQTRQSALTLANGPFMQQREYLSPLINRTVSGFAVPVPGLDRVLVAEAQVAQVGEQGEAGQFVLQMGLLLVLAFFILLLLWLFYESTVVTPMHQLAAVAERAVQGHSVEAIATPTQQDEIGNLMLAFSTMTQLTQRNIQALEVRVAERTHDIEATREIGQIISSLRDVDTLLNRVVQLIRDRFEAIYHAQVFLLDSTRQFAVLRVSTGEAGAALLARGHRLAVGSQSVIGRTTADGEPVVALDTSTSPIHRANELLPETRAELALPLRTREGIIGALDLQSKHPEAFSDADIRLFQSIADQLAIAITNAQLFEESQARLAEIEALNRRLLGEAWSGYETVRRRALPSAKRTTEAPEAWSPLQLQAVSTRALAEHVEADLVSFAVPVILRDQVFGAVEWTVPRANYTENTRLLARELAARLAVTADNARLLEQSQRLVSRERLISDIAGKLSQQTDVARVLQVAIRELGLALRVPQTSIRLTTSSLEGSPESVEVRLEESK